VVASQAIERVSPVGAYVASYKMLPTGLKFQRVIG
jgi:hypothetical protein